MPKTIGSTPDDFSLDDLSYTPHSLSLYSGHIVVLSFIDIINGWDWLRSLINIYNRFNDLDMLSDITILPVFFNYNGAGLETISSIPYSGSMTLPPEWVSAKITDQGLTVPFPCLIDNSAWASTVSLSYMNGFITDTQFSGGAGTDMWTYIISKDYKISDKWHTNCLSATPPSNNNPISFNYIPQNTVIIKPEGTFSSGEITLSLSGITNGGGTPLTGKTQITYNGTPPAYTPDFSGPRIKSVIPVDGSTIASPTPIIITFTEPVLGAVNPANYTFSGPGTVTLTPLLASSVVYENYPTFDSKQYYTTPTTEQYLIHRVINLKLPPAILYSDPEEHTTYSSLPSETSFIFSNPVDHSSATYTITGAGLTGTGTTPDYTNRNMIENIVDTGLSGTVADGAVNIQAGSITDTDTSSPTPLAGDTTINYTADISGPNAPTVNTSGTTPTNDTTPEWTWSSGGGGGSGNYRYRLDNTDLSAQPETTATTFTPGAPLSFANHILYVQERDAVNNWSTSGSFTINVTNTDMTDPTVTITCPTAASRHHPDTPITVTLNEVGGGVTGWNITHTTGSVAPTPDPANASLWTVPPAPSIYTLFYADDNYRIYVFAKDAANNVGSGYVEINLTLWRDCVVVMDCSESMNHPPADATFSTSNKNVLADDAVTYFFSQLHNLYIDTDPYAANDRYGLVNYSSTAIVTSGALVSATSSGIAPLASFSSGTIIDGVVDNVPPMLGTAIGSGIANGLNMLDFNTTNADYNRLRFIFLFADGEQNVHPYTNPNYLDPATNTQFSIDTTHPNSASAGCAGIPVFTVDQNDIRVKIHTCALGTVGSWTDRLNAISIITNGTHYLDGACYPINTHMETEISDSLYYGSSPQVVTNQTAKIVSNDKVISFNLNSTIKRGLFCLSWLGDEDLTFTLKKGSSTINVPQKDIINGKRFLFVRVDFPHYLGAFYGLYEKFLDKIKDMEFTSGEKIVEALKKGEIDLKAAQAADLSLKTIADAANTFAALNRAGVKETEIIKSREIDIKILRKARVTTKQLNMARNNFKKMNNVNISVKALMLAANILSDLAVNTSISDILSNQKFGVKLFKRRINAQGNWRMIISRTNNSPIGEIQYYASVIVEDKLIKYAVGNFGYANIGDILELQVDFIHPFGPYINDLITDVNISAPVIAAGNVAATHANLIKPAPLSNNEQSISYTVYSQLYRNKFAGLKLQKRKLHNIKLKSTAKKTVSGNNSSIAKGALKKTKVPGVYEIKYKIKGTGKELEYFERIITKSVVINSKPDPKKSKFTQEFILSKHKAVFTIIPKDKYNNFIGPGFENAFDIKGIEDKKPVINDAYNGSYRIEIACETPQEFAKLKPQIIFSGKTIYSGDSKKKGCFGKFFK